MELRSETSCRAADYLAFRLARQDFLIASNKVRGIVPADQLVPVRHPVSWVRGVAGVLGREFPVIDLRVKLGMPEASHGKRPLLIVVEVRALEADVRLVGFIADKVSDIVSHREADFRRDTVRVNGRPKSRISLDQLLTSDELQMLGRVPLYAIGIKTAV